MSIKYIVLGYINWKPATSYELKRIISDSETLSWSGNSNQVYRALVDLHKSEYVTLTVEHQDKLPARKIYTITELGKQALNEWARQYSGEPNITKPFLAHLLWTDELNPAELDALLEQYLNAVGEKLFMVRVQADRKPDMPERTPREAYLWEMVHRNWIATYELELDWIRQMKQTLVDHKREFSRRT